jgi:hypothetical protein
LLVRWFSSEADDLFGGSSVYFFSRVKISINSAVFTGVRADFIAGHAGKIPPRAKNHHQNPGKPPRVIKIINEGAKKPAAGQKKPPSYKKNPRAAQNSASKCCNRRRSPNESVRWDRRMSEGFRRAVRPAR